MSSDIGQGKYLAIAVGLPIALFLAAVLVFFVHTYYSTAVYARFNCVEKAGQFGDRFGDLNSFFSALAFASRG